jgi:hypothetical protein
MRKLSGLIACVTVLCLALPVSAQVGHPAKGSWLGYWGTSDDDRNRILLVLDWENREIIGTINPGRNSVMVKRAVIDYDNWTMTIEADMPIDGGGTATYVAIGNIENLGSWVNRRFSGRYTHGSESGTFSMTLN